MMLASIGWRPARSCVARFSPAGSAKRSGGPGRGGSRGFGACAPSTCSIESFVTSRYLLPGHERNPPERARWLRETDRSARPRLHPASRSPQSHHHRRYARGDRIGDGVRFGVGPLGRVAAARVRPIRHGGRSGSAPGGHDHDLRGVLRLDARPGGRIGAVQRDRAVLSAGRGAARPAAAAGARVPRRPRGLAHRVVHAGAGRRAGPHGPGRDCPARRARAAAGRADAVSRSREPRSVAVLDRRGAGVRHLGDGGAACAVRGARGGRALREAAAPPTRNAPGPRARAAISERTVSVVRAAGRDIAPAKGTLGVMLVGLGAVSTTFIAGVENVRRGTGLPIGSLSQMGTIRLGKRTDKRSPKIKEFVPLAELKDLVLAAWDPIPDDAYTAARKAGVLEPHHLEPIGAFLTGIKPLPAAFEPNSVKGLPGTNVKPGKTKRDLAEQLRQDIRDFKKRSGADRLVMIWAASTEVFLTPGPAHQSLQAFERAMEQNDPA